jgi:hypothetical protein
MTIMRALLPLLVLAGCTTEMTMPPPADMSPARPALTLRSDEYTLAAQAEKYYCYTVDLDRDVAIDEVIVHNGTRTHHVAIFSTLAPEPAGFSECPSLIKQTWVPLYGGGQGTPGIKLPQGAAFKFPKGQQMLMQLHLVNASPTAVTERTSADLIYAAGDPSTLTPAGIFAVGNSSFELAVGATNVPVVGKCAAPKPLDVFALFPHMHRLGKSISLEHGASEATAKKIFSVDPWSFGDQPMTEQVLKVQKGDFLRATCVYDNTDGVKITYGESTFNEMCFMVLFYTPYDRLGACIN